GTISTGSPSPFARAAASTLSRPAPPAASPVPPDEAPCPEWSPALAETDGVAPPSEVRSSSMLAPVYCDQVSPVADRNSSPAAAQAPTVPCRLRVRRRPEVPRSLRRARLRANHSTRPPSATTHSQLAASSLYQRPASPSRRSR